MADNREECSNDLTLENLTFSVQEYSNYMTLENVKRSLKI